jgi:hypothetical protein
LEQTQYLDKFCKLYQIKDKKIIARHIAEKLYLKPILQKEKKNGKAA